MWACEVASVLSVWLFVTLWTWARQDPLPMGFLRQEYWSGLLCPLPDLQPITLTSPHWQVGSFPLAPPRKYTLWVNTIVTYPDEWDDNGVESCYPLCSVTMPCLAICILCACMCMHTCFSGSQIFSSLPQSSLKCYQLFG